VIQPHDDCLTSAIEVEISDGVAGSAPGIKAAKNPFVVAVAIDGRRRVDGSALRPAGKCCDRSRDAYDGVNTAGFFLDIDTGIRWRYWHRFEPLARFVSFGLGGFQGLATTEDRFRKQLEESLSVRGGRDDSRMKGFSPPVGINLSKIKNHFVLVVANSKQICVASMQEFLIHVVQFCQLVFASQGPFLALPLINDLMPRNSIAVTEAV